jgi:hypothetical protein
VRLYQGARSHPDQCDGIAATASDSVMHSRSAAGPPVKMHALARHESRIKTLTAGIEASKLNALEKHLTLYFPHINRATAI